MIAEHFTRHKHSCLRVVLVLLANLYVLSQAHGQCGYNANAANTNEMVAWPDGDHFFNVQHGRDKQLAEVYPDNVAPEGSLSTPPKPYVLFENHPGAMRFCLAFSFDRVEQVSLTVFSLSGKLVMAEERAVGQETISYEYNLPAGIYLLKLAIGGMCYTERIIVTR